MIAVEFEQLLQLSVYAQDRAEKSRILTDRLTYLTHLHYDNCKEYRDILDSLGCELALVKDYRDIPFLPVRIFKELSLRSVEEQDIVKTMTSSGTSGQRVSKIYLDKTTAANQQKAMIKIVSEFIGSHRLPMIVIDSPSVLKDRASFSARGAGILGFSMFGSDRMFALNDDMSLNISGLKAYLEKYAGKPILLFGFTFMIWKHFYYELERLAKEGVRFDLSQGVLIHGGGWKKLVSESVSPSEFNRRLKDICGIERVHNYYGMVEQTGCIYMECECGHLHASVFSDVIIRRPIDFKECPIGEEGVIQVVSTIPESYPGHSLLTEDLGTILGEDDCPCGRKGKYFSISGRMTNAEIRGCSDTYATKFN